MKPNPLFFVLCIITILLCNRLHAQDPDPATQQAATETESGNVETATSQSIGGLILSGGLLNVVFFGILGVFSLWAATVIFERVFNLRRDKLMPQSFRVDLEKIAESPDLARGAIRELCERHDCVASKILAAGLFRAGRPVPEVEKAMEDAAAREMAMLRAKSRPLSVVGNIAPLVGLLGTVVGMILAFQISSQEGLGKAERLAEGIYLALMTTAAGLTVAIPCLLFSSWFHGKAEKFMCEIAETLTKSLNCFATMEPGRIIEPPVVGEVSAREKFLNEGTVETSQSS